MFNGSDLTMDKSLPLLTAIWLDERDHHPGKWSGERDFLTSGRQKAKAFINWSNLQPFWLREGYEATSVVIY